MREKIYFSCLNESGYVSCVTWPFLRRFLNHIMHNEIKPYDKKIFDKGPKLQGFRH